MLVRAHLVRSAFLARGGMVFLVYTTFLPRTIFGPLGASFNLLRSEETLHSLDCILDSAVALRFAHAAVRWHCLARHHGDHLSLHVSSGLFLFLHIPALRYPLQFL